MSQMKRLELKVDQLLDELENTKLDHRKMYLAHAMLLGHTNREASKRVKRTEQTILLWKHDPAYKRYMTKMKTLMNLLFAEAVVKGDLKIQDNPLLRKTWTNDPDKAIEEFKKKQRNPRLGRRSKERS